MDRLIVGVSGINAGDNPGPGIGVARSLMAHPELELEIVGLAYDALEPGLYMDWLIQKSYTVPYPSKGGQGFLNRLRYIRDAYGLDCVVPNLDAELPLYIRYQETLASEGIRVVVPTMEQFRLRSKDRLPEIASELQIDVPPTRVAYDEAQFAAALREFGMPVILKGTFYEAHKAYSEGDAYMHYRKLIADWGFPVIVQQIVSGQEINVVGVGDGEGGSLGMVGMKKMSLTSLGKVWAAVTVYHEKAMAVARRFLARYEWNGPFELEYMINANHVYLIEINPRFPAWVYFATGAGINLPARMLDKAIGRPRRDAAEFEVGKFFMRYTYEIVTDMDRFRHVLMRGETGNEPLRKTDDHHSASELHEQIRADHCRSPEFSW